MSRNDSTGSKMQYIGTGARVMVTIWPCRDAPDVDADG